MSLAFSRSDFQSFDLPFNPIKPQVPKGQYGRNTLITFIKIRSLLYYPFERRFKLRQNDGTTHTSTLFL
jgi:hypothetical protein